MFEWLKDPEGHKYRFVGPVVGGGVHVEYELYEPLVPKVPFKSFVVEMRGRTFHVQAPSKETVWNIFCSKYSSGCLRPEDVTVEEAPSNESQ